MQLNSNGKLAQFYLICSEENATLPDDLCSYFWGLVFKSLVVLSLGGVILVALILVLTEGVMWMWAHKVGAAIAISSVALAFFIVWISERTKDRKKKVKIEILSEAKTIIQAKVDAVKNRYCPRIEWK